MKSTYLCTVNELDYDNNLFEYDEEFVEGDRVVVPVVGDDWYVKVFASDVVVVAANFETEH